MRVLFSLFAFLVFTCAVADGQDGRMPVKGSSAEIAARLRDEAARLEVGHLTEFFAAIAEGGARERLGLSLEQIEAARDVEDTVRAVLRGWLLKGLDKQPPTPASELAERLGERGDRLRRAVVGHAESITLEAVLTAAQTRRLSSKLHLPAAKPLAGRFGPLPSTDGQPLQAAVEVDFVIRANADRLKNPRYPASELFAIITAAEKALPTMSDAQITLVRRLDSMARVTLSNWLLRGLGRPPAQGFDPPRADLIDRLMVRWPKLRASIMAHAEHIALDAVLEPEQADRARQLLWRQRGVESLLDPELADRLRLTRSQRDEISGGIMARKTVVEHLSSNVATMWAETLRLRNNGTPEQVRQANESAQSAAEARKVGTAEADSAILDVLTPSQLRSFYRLLGRPVSGRSDTTSKRPVRPG